MKRHPSLRDLSVDHHHALVQARRLIKSSAEEGPQAEEARIEAAHGFFTFFSEYGNRHFREEEEVLFPTYARYADPSEPTIVRVLVEHVRIRTLVEELYTQVDAGGPSPDTLRRAGELLHAHVRLEEDVVFPLIEKAVPEEAMPALFDRLADFARTGSAR